VTVATQQQQSPGRSWRSRAVRLAMPRSSGSGWCD